jgi:tetratricopeptide (TPR) repeat protein
MAESTKELTETGAAVTTVVTENEATAPAPAEPEGTEIAVAAAVEAGGEAQAPAPVEAGPPSADTALVDRPCTEFLQFCMIGDSASIKAALADGMVDIKAPITEMEMSGLEKQLSAFFLDASANLGDLAMLIAAGSGDGEGHASIVSLLLGADVSTEAASSQGRTALMIAALKGFNKTVKVLLDAMANLTPVSTDDEEMDALQCAAAGGDQDTIVMLLEAGADPLATDPRGTGLVGVYMEGCSAREVPHAPVVADLLKDAMVATEAANRATIEADPANAAAHFNLGLILSGGFEVETLFLKPEGFDEAEGMYRKAIELDPGNAKAKCNLAGVLWMRADHIERLDRDKLESAAGLYDECASFWEACPKIKECEGDTEGGDYLRSARDAAARIRAK